MQTEKPSNEQRKPEKPTTEKATTDKPTTQKPSKERPVEVAMEIDESVVKPERKIDHQQKKEVNNGPNAATQNPSKSEKVASESTINNRRKCPEENLQPSGMNTGGRSIITTSQVSSLPVASVLKCIIWFVTTLTSVASVLKCISWFVYFEMPHFAVHFLVSPLTFVWLS